MKKVEKRISELKKGTRVVFRNKWGEMQKGTFTGEIDEDGYGVFVCRPFSNNKEVDCLFPVECKITVLTEEEFQARPWVK
jgi:hypothetical protein